LLLLRFLQNLLQNLQNLLNLLNLQTIFVFQQAGGLVNSMKILDEAATKVDDAEVPIDLWNDVLLEDMER